MTRQCLVHVYGPQNLLSAIAAVRWRGFLNNNGNESAEVVTVLHTPGWSDEKMRENLIVASTLCRSQRWPDPVIITSDHLQQMARSSNDPCGATATENFRRIFGNFNFDEVYYAHNVVGDLPSLMMKSYPRATKITYGESLGWLVEKEYVIAQASNAGWDEAAYQSRGTVQDTSNEATEAVLVLPADSTGDCLKGKNLSVPPRSLVLAILDDFKKVLPEIATISPSLVNVGKSNNYLILLSNLADAGSSTIENELAFYTESIRAVAPAGSRLVIKPHPLSVIPIEKMLCEQLSHEYSIERIPETLNRYPIEIWDTVVNSCEVLSNSYTIISLEYLFRKKVHFTLTPERIKKYINRPSWNYFNDQHQVLGEQRDALKHWNGREVLWTGRRKSHAPESTPPPTTVIDSKQSDSDSAEKSYTNNLADGAAFFVKVLSPPPRDHLHLLNKIAEDLSLIKEAKEKIQYLSFLHATFSDDPTIATKLCEILIQQSEIDAARAVCTSYVKRLPDNANMQELLRLLGGPITPLPPKAVLQGSWAECAAYLDIHHTAIIGPGAHVDVRYRPHQPGICVSIGQDSQMFGTISILRPGGKVSIGERTQIGASALITADEITIGDDVLMAWGITVMDNDSHSLNWEERKNDVLQCGKDWRENPRDFIRNKDWSKVKIKPIRIGDKAWIGFGVAILKGVTIGEGAVIAAQSVVTKDIPPFTLAAGNPARIIRSLPQPGTQEGHE
jgi:acetyltransferase-like isoleucine patch superfamily enzyme